MTFDFKYTRHQTARGTLADAEDRTRFALVKSASRLHTTYQIRLLVYRALTEGKELWLYVLPTRVFEEDISELVEMAAGAIVVQHTKR